MFGPHINFPKTQMSKVGYKGGARFGIVMAGGPASGANAVISTFSILAIDDDFEVVGFRKGFEYLEEFLPGRKGFLRQGEIYTLIDKEVVQLRNRGGSILSVSRANPGRHVKKLADLNDPEKSKPIRNILNAFEFIGVGVLITIGGDDTLKIANLIHHAGMPVIHVPKTIDNDYYGIPWTFGYWTAVETAKNILLNLKRDAETTDSWFIVELMGRKAGWITYASGVAGECDLMLSAEDFEGEMINLERLVSDLTAFIISREDDGKPYGLICVAESLVAKLPEEFQPKETDRHHNVRLSAAKIGELLAAKITAEYEKKTGRKRKVMPFNVGYDIRCAQPTSFDVVMSCMLGYGAYKLAAQGKFGHMVSVTEDFGVKAVPFSDLVDPATLFTRNRTVPIDSDFYNLQRLLSWNPVMQG